MIVPVPARTIVLVVLTALLPAVPAGAAVKAPPVPRGNPTLVLATPAGEKTVPAIDMAFVYFDRIYYHRGAPRSQVPSGERIDVEDRRKECQCLRLEDRSRIRFSKIRQIEIAYPPEGVAAEVRVTFFDGRVKVIGAADLAGAMESEVPRFAARVDGELREYPLVVRVQGAWPDERLVRLLLKRPPPRKTGRH